MIEHVTLRCSDVSKSRRFYEKVLAPLGYRVAFEFDDSVGFKAQGHTSFWLSNGGTGGVTTHIAFRAPNRKAVEAFHERALEAGAKDNGRPGLRDYSPTYYAAFVLDPDGHNMEAVTFVSPPKKAKAKATAKKKRAPAAKTSARSTGARRKR